ncbi:hypothetical protein [Plantactinospora sp. B24E8]|uniref:hypothetical protein n=1 Tax=Plantactinospora sp. B24E8 TaxID=3153567 RepID=UPI00325D5F45
MTPPEARELAALVLDHLAPRLPELAAPRGTPGRNTPVRQLYALVAKRFHALDEQETLVELARDPRNNSLARRLLAQAVIDDQEYAAALAAAVAALAAAVAALPAEERPAARTAEHAVAQPAEQPAAAGQGSEGSAEERRPRRWGGWIALAALVVLGVAGFLVVRSVVDNLSGAGGLTAQSSCTEYRQAPPEERVAAIREIGLAKGVSGADSPLVMTAIDQLCDSRPEATIGELIGRLK